MKASLLAWIAYLADHCVALGAWARRAWDVPAPAWTLPPPPRRPKLTPEEQMRRGQEARGLLEHPLFLEAAHAVEGTLARHRQRVPMADQTMHTRLILMEQCWGNLKGYLHQAMMSGELSAQKLLREQAESQRRRSALKRGIRA